MAPKNESCQDEDDKPSIILGPDLNESRSPFDKKVYRQILLPNGLRVLLVSDTIAMTQTYNAGGIYEEISDDDKSKEDSKADDDQINDESKSQDDDDNEDENEEEEEEDGGLRNAAAAMICGVGSINDPPECQGLAHFLEHLLFMGSNKYPEENAYDEFISKHGGSDNAWTEFEHTCYHFEIPQEHLKGALDMFAQFFTHPLLLENSVERELKSIESEFQLVKNSDSCRVQHLMCHTCGHEIKEHPMAKFSWGNLQSLKEVPKLQNVDPMEKLRAFYKEHYYASNMRLVVIGAYTLDVLQDYIVKSFSDVPRKGLDFSFEQKKNDTAAPMKDIGMPFTNACLEKIFYIAPVGDLHALTVTWQVPSQMENWKCKPCDYLAHLIGHEAEGSFLASLKVKSWATSVCAGVGGEGYENASSYALFIVSITLSEEGVANWRQVVAELYRYVGMLRYHCEDGLPKWIFEELKSIQEISHKYDDEPSPEDLVENLAESMAPEYNLPAERLLDGDALLFEYEPAAIQDLVNNFFTPHNARLDMASTKFGRSADYESIESFVPKECLTPSDGFFEPSSSPPPQEEPIFGTRYWCQSLSDLLLQEWADLSQPQLPPPESKLSIPQKNSFVPSNFALKPLPPADCDHPLLNCSIKLQITVGKRKARICC
jgi:nardilysin